MKSVDTDSFYFQLMANIPEYAIARGDEITYYNWHISNTIFFVADLTLPDW
jgi:hypothetical protein